MKTVRAVKVEGLAELATALQGLTKATARNVLKRVLTKRAQPMAATMRGLAPDDPATTGKRDLKTSIGVGTKLSKRQARMHRKEHKDDKQFAEVFVGAGPLPQAHLTEYGGPNNSPVGYGRSSWDQHQDSILAGLKDDLWTEIDKTAKRLAKKRAKLAAKG